MTISVQRRLSIDHQRAPVAGDLWFDRIDPAHAEQMLVVLAVTDLTVAICRTTIQQGPKDLPAWCLDRAEVITREAFKELLNGSPSEDVEPPAFVVPGGAKEVVAAWLASTSDRVANAMQGIFDRQRATRLGGTPSKILFRDDQGRPVTWDDLTPPQRKGATKFFGST